MRRMKLSSLIKPEIDCYIENANFTSFLRQGCPDSLESWEELSLNFL